MTITLLYHHVNDDFANNITISTANFRQQMQFLRDSNYRVISLDTALQISRTADNGNFILLTFDDGYEDFYINAFPILQEFGFSAAVFPIVETIGHWNEWNRRAPYIARHLSWPQIIELSRANIGFGCHTFSHHSLVRFNGQRQYREMAMAKDQLEARLGQAITSISYPYGDYDDATKQRAAELFEVGFTVDHGYWRWRIDPFAIRRLKIGPTTTLPQLSETLVSIANTADVLPPLSVVPDIKT
jgi:peptidoglycan/xylan/chitin deacetylase (PgdA/CDA1 family)